MKTPRARIRSIHPEHLTDKRVVSLSHAAYRLWIALIQLADDEGRGIADPEEIKIRVPALRDENIDQLLQELQEKLRKFVIYETQVGDDTERFYAFLNWGEYQKPKKPNQSTIPEPFGTSSEPVGNQFGTSSEPVGVGVGVGAGAGIGVGENPPRRKSSEVSRAKRKSKKDKDKDDVNVGELVKLFAELWNAKFPATPFDSGAGLGGALKRKVRAMMKTGPPDQVKQVAEAAVRLWFARERRNYAWDYMIKDWPSLVDTVKKRMMVGPNRTASENGGVWISRGGEWVKLKE